MGNLSIPLNDPKHQYEALKSVLDGAVAWVLASGTDALEIGLRALNISPSAGFGVFTFAPPRLDL